LAPASVQEAADLTTLAFDLAWKYRHVAVVMADGMIGQVMEPCELPPYRSQTATRPDWAVYGAEGRQHRIITSLFLNPEELEQMNAEIPSGQREICAGEVRYVQNAVADADIIIVAYGIMARICQTAIKMARAKGIAVGLFRPVSLYPFPYGRVDELASTAKAFLVAEMSAGQMIEDVQLAVGRTAPVHFFNRMGGVVPLPEEILAKIESLAERLPAHSYAGAYSQIRCGVGSVPAAAASLETEAK